MLQITHPRKKKVTTINVSNIVHVQPYVERRRMRIVLLDNSEMVFKAESHQLLVLWIAALKVSMSNGMHITIILYYHMAHKILMRTQIDKNDNFCDSSKLSLPNISTT